MNIKELEERLGIKSSTLRKWEKDFNFNISKDENGHRIYSEEDYRIFQQIKDLRESGTSVEAIKKILHLETGSKKGSSATAKTKQVTIDRKSYSEPEFVRNEPARESGGDMYHKLDMMESTLVNKFDSIMELSEKYSRAAYRIGALESQLEAKDQQIQMISENFNRELAGLQKELEKKAEENETLRKEINQIRASRGEEAYTQLPVQEEAEENSAPQAINPNPVVNLQNDLVRHSQENLQLLQELERLKEKRSSETGKTIRTVLLVLFLMAYTIVFIFYIYPMAK